MKSCEQHFFLDLNFLFPKIQATKTVNIFGIWIFYFRKIKWKSVLAAKKAVFWREIQKVLTKIIFSWTVDKKLMKFYENSSFSEGANTVKIFSPNPTFTPPFGLCVVHIPQVWFLKQMPGRKIFWGELLRRSHKN